MEAKRELGSEGCYARAGFCKNDDTEAGMPGSQQGRDEKSVVLSGGNPQIARGDGDGPVQACIAAMPGWKREVGRMLDALIVETLPGETLFRPSRRRA